MKDATETRKRAQSRLAAMKTERSSWDSHWRDISTSLLPRTGRWQASARNQGGRKHQAILDASATYALGVLASGLMSGATSPARPWFGLALPDADLAKRDGVQVWVDQVADLMRDEMARTNIYRALPAMYRELGCYGTAAAFCRPMRAATADPQNERRGLLHFYPLTVGEYWLGQSDLNVVDSLYREFDMSVGQLVQQFGEANVSNEVREMWKRGERDKWFTVVQAIEPREDRDPELEDNANMPWRSLYYEAGSATDKVLMESGFEYFPCLAPRWQTTSGDIYGEGPGMLVIGAIEQLQHQQWRKGQAIDYQTQPPKQAPASMEGREVSMLPGSTTFGGGPGDEIKAIFKSDLRIDHLHLDMQEVRARIREGFFTDLFLMLAQSDRRQMTAAEVAERHEEKLLMLGPVLENLHDELLRPLINQVFSEMAANGKLPPPPPDLVGIDLQVEFTSMLAMAQKAMGVNAQDRFMATVTQLSERYPEVVDRVNVDEVVDDYARRLGIPAKLLVPVAQAQEIRKARNDAFRAKEQMAMLQSQAMATKDLAQAPVGGPQPNALDAVTAVTE